MNRTVLNIICALLTVPLALLAQEEKDDAGTINLQAIKITVEPPKPQIALKIKEIKPREYDFFRSFEDEVKSIPQDMLNVKVDNTEQKVEDLDQLLKKDRK